MSSKTTQWILEFVDKITAPLRSVQGAADDAAEAVDAVNESLDETGNSGSRLPELGAKIGAAAFVFNQVSDAIGKFNAGFQGAIAPGVAFQSQMAELSAVTQMTGDDLNAIGNRARGLAKEFGTDASAQVEVFKDIIARFGPDVAESSDALEGMGRSVSVLSKLMGGDAKASTDALTTAMLQYGVDLTDPIAATGEMERIMNILVAGGNAGSSEVSDTAEALKVVGLTAKQSGVSVEQFTSAMQALGTGSLYGSEAGTKFRNVLTNIASTSMIPKDTVKGLIAAGVNMKTVTDSSLSLTDRLRELKKVAGSDLIMQMFGANTAAAEVLMQTTEQQDEWTSAISSTNAAMDGANIIMDTYAEKQSRTAAWTDNLKIGFFNATESIAPFITITGEAMNGITDLGIAVWSLSILFKKDLWAGVWSAITATTKWIGTNVIAKVATLAVTAAQWLWNIALSANPIGIVIGVVAGLLAGIMALWSKCEGFRAVLYGLWEVAKGFGNIIKDFIVDRIRGFLTGIGALGQAISKLFKGDFSGAWKSAKEGVSGIIGVDAVKNAYSSAKGLGEAYAKGAAEGRATFANRNRGADAASGSAVGTVVQTAAEKKTLKDATKNITAGNNKTSGNGKGNKSLNLSGGSGSGSGGRSITMNVTMNITNNGLKNPDEFTEQVVRKINDRLNDSLAAAG
ncbi:MAG: phage tail tape measure protein [Bacteroidales bacterium]|jgi:TP901 family phage tail tape measure protein|nr:phage tail tape measure protein [Bacteroidales bacterium]